MSGFILASPKDFVNPPKETLIKSMFRQAFNFEVCIFQRFPREGDFLPVLISTLSAIFSKG
jgi:hypothetical protein